MRLVYAFIHSQVFTRIYSILFSAQVQASVELLILLGEMCSAGQAPRVFWQDVAAQNSHRTGTGEHVAKRAVAGSSVPSRK